WPATTGGGEWVGSGVVWSKEKTLAAATARRASTPANSGGARSPPICQSCNRPSSTFHNGASVHERCHRRYCLATAGGLRYPNPPSRKCADHPIPSIRSPTTNKALSGIRIIDTTHHHASPRRPHTL